MSDKRYLFLVDGNCLRRAVLDSIRGKVGVLVVEDHKGGRLLYLDLNASKIHNLMDDTC